MKKRTLNIKIDTSFAQFTEQNKDEVISFRIDAKLAKAFKRLREEQFKKAKPSKVLRQLLINMCSEAGYYKE